MRELYITFGPGNKANADLNPESMLNYEVSIGQYFWNNRIHAEVTAFYIDGKNMIHSRDSLRMSESFIIRVLNWTQIFRFYEIYAFLQIIAFYIPIRKLLLLLNINGF